MLNKIRNRQGFTLIELLIVVAIIGILAAVAIPQFSAYRQKGFNAAANADIKNAKTAQEALFADHQTYGRTPAAALMLTATDLVDNTGGAGNILTGPMVAATEAVLGAALTAPRPNPATSPPAAAIPTGVGISLSNKVSFASSSTVAATPAWTSNSYTMVSKHLNGTRVFATEAEGTAVFYVQNDAWGNIAMTSITGAPAAGIAAPAVGQEITATLAGGGVPTATWTPL